MFERGPEHVVADRQFRRRVDDNPISGQHAVRDVAANRVQRDGRVDQLANAIDGPFAADRRTPGLRERDDRLKRDPARGIRYNAQRGRAARVAFDAAHVDERGVAERRQPRNPLPQRKFERAHPEQVGSHVQDALAAVDGQAMADGAQRVGIARCSIAASHGGMS